MTSREWRSKEPHSIVRPKTMAPSFALNVIPVQANDWDTRQQMSRIAAAKRLKDEGVRMVKIAVRFLIFRLRCRILVLILLGLRGLSYFARIGPVDSGSFTVEKSFAGSLELCYGTLV